MTRNKTPLPIWGGFKSLAFVKTSFRNQERNVTEPVNYTRANLKRGR